MSISRSGNVNKISKYFFIILLIQAGRSVNSVTIFGAFPEIPISILSILYLYFIGFKFTKSLFYAIAIWTAYFIISSFWVGAFSPLYFARIPLLLVTGFAIASQLRYEIINLYVKYIYILALISLLFYLWTLINVVSLLQFLQTFGISDSGGNHGIFVFNLKERALYRNSGFCWEPGPFSVFCVIALAFELIQNGFRLSNKVIIFLLAIATTQSSTGGVLLLILLAFWLYSKVKNFWYLIIFVPFFAMGSIHVYNQIPFLKEKINVEFNELNEEDRIIRMGKLRDKAIGSGRFMQFKIAFNDIKERPFLGYSSNDDLRWVVKNKVNLFDSGLGGDIARYGIIMITMFFFLVYKSGERIGLYLDSNKFSFLWLIFIISIMFSFSSISSSPLFFCFYMLGFGDSKSKAIKIYQ